jgi:hypothetical protein
MMHPGVGVNKFLCSAQICGPELLSRLRDFRRLKRDNSA